MQVERWQLAACAVLLGFGSVAPALAQPAMLPPPQTAQAPVTAAQLDSILAPIALYPDVLLTQVLIAATQPAEVVQAQRWLDNPANRALTGPALEQALAPLPWDPSVKSLVPFPNVLSLLGDHLDWTQQLAWSAQTQQEDVLNSIQRLRQQAQQAGTLVSSANYMVRDEPGPAGTAIVIEPAQPDTVVVPVYDPARVYGPWLYPAYPPVVYASPAVSFPAVGLAFGAGILVAGGLWALSTPDWGHRRIDVNVNRWQAIGHGRPVPAWAGGRPGFRPPVPGPRPGFPGHPFPVGGPGPVVPPGARPVSEPGHGAPFHPEPHGVPGPIAAPRLETPGGRGPGEVPHPQSPRGPEHEAMPRPQPSHGPTPNAMRPMPEPAVRPAHVGRPEAAPPPHAEPHPGPSAGRPEPHHEGGGRPEQHQGNEHNG